MKKLTFILAGYHPQHLKSEQEKQRKGGEFHICAESKSTETGNLTAE